MVRENFKWWPHEKESTEARPRDGPTRRSEEAPVMGVEQRGWVIRLRTATNQRWEELMESTKPFRIAKQAVWEAYKRVKANHGAAGVDEESITAFEENLKDNLYKLWNRLSSGSYFPPPVKVVLITKKEGGQRQLGVPTVADRIAQTVAKLTLEPLVEP